MRAKDIYAINFHSRLPKKFAHKCARERIITCVKGGSEMLF